MLENASDVSYSYTFARLKLTCFLSLSSILVTVLYHSIMDPKQCSIINEYHTAQLYNMRCHILCKALLYCQAFLLHVTRRL